MATKDDLGRGPSRPGDIPGARRPYATIDAKATEVDGKPPGAAAAAASATAKSETKAQDAARDVNAKAPGQAGAAFTAGLASIKPGAGTVPLLTHLAAGVAGAVVVLLASQVLGWGRTPARVPELGELSRRLADVEGGLGARPGAGVRGRVEELSRSVSALGEDQGRLARDTKALEAKVSSAPELPADLVSRLAKLEESLAALSSATQSGQPPQFAALALKLADIEKTARDAGEAAKASATRTDGDLASARTEIGRVAQRIDSLRGEVDERLRGAAKASDVAPLATKMGALERDLQSLLGGEAERKANTSRVVLGLELGNLKRAVDRGESYTAELAQVKKLAGSAFDLSALERSMQEGVPTVQTLAKSFRKVANAMLEAEEQSADAGILDRLVSGARNIVRVRKAGHAPGDTSAEAVVGRMEAALKEGRLSEVLAQAKTLPPKAELAGEDWVKKVAARQAVDQALADVEAALKTSLGAVPPDAKR